MVPQTPKIIFKPWSDASACRLHCRTMPDERINPTMLVILFMRSRHSRLSDYIVCVSSISLHISPRQVGGTTCAEAELPLLASPAAA